MKIIFLILFSFCFTTYSDPGRDEKKIKLGCEITSQKHIYKVGEIPQIQVSILNKSKQHIYLIGSLDGSDLQWRMPYCYFTIIKPTIDTPEMVMRCGNTNPLRADDFKWIKPAETFDPYERVDDYGFFSNHEVSSKKTFKNPGIYKIQFHYSTNSNEIGKFLGTPEYRKDPIDSAKVETFFLSVPKVELASNILEIKIVE